MLIVIVQFVLVGSDGTLKLLTVLLICCILLLNVLLFFALALLPLFQSSLVVDVSEPAT